MNAQQALRDARAAGVRVKLARGTLALQADAQPPASVVVALRQHKAEIVALMEAGAAIEWTTNDWRAFFHERAGIAQHDGGQSRAEAEAFAFERCVIEWQNHNPEPSKPGSCAHCGGAEVTGTTLIPVLAGDAHTWLHDHCWRQWMAAQQDRAIRALAVMKIHGPK